MLNNRQHIFTQTVAIVLACAFMIVLMTPYTHVSGHELDGDRQCQHCSGFDESTCSCCQTNSDCHQKSDHSSDHSQHKCNCWCLNSLLSILPQIEIQTGLKQQPLYLLECKIRIPQMERDIFRPPRS